MPVTLQEETGRRRGLSDESRSVRSPWVWRGFAFMTLVSLGLAITFSLDGYRAYGVAWALITVAWGATAGVLWKAHLRVS